MQYFFAVSGYEDDDTTVRTPGKALMEALREGMVRAGYECGPVAAADWGWFFRALQNDTHFLCGGEVYPEVCGGFRGARAFIERQKSGAGLLERVLGRGVQSDTSLDSADDDFMEIMKAMEGVTEVRQER